MKLRQHAICLSGPRVVLRPLTEQDWPVLLDWYNDPQILYYSEGDEIAGYSLEDLQDVFRSVSQQGYCFLIEYTGQPIGDCWLQEMNLPRVLEQYPGMDCRRIDLAIGERSFWRQGLGTEVIQLLTTFAFDHEQADCVWGCDVAEDNPGSLGAFTKAGYHVMNAVGQPPGSKVARRFDLARFRLISL
jgi:RimJ/RimL family protein N-acetyltransferase